MPATVALLVPAVPGRQERQAAEAKATAPSSPPPAPEWKPGLAMALEPVAQPFLGRARAQGPPTAQE